MQGKMIRQVVLGSLLCLAMVGCSNNAKSGRGSADGVHTYGAGSGSHFSGSSDAERELMARRTIYFDFDRSTIQQEDYRNISAHAHYLKHHRSARVRVEGHTDEYGSREYNIALGERRAYAVSQVLLSEGVSPSQVAKVSFGKEKPASTAHTQEAHRLNRRAIIVYEEM